MPELQNQGPQFGSIIDRPPPHGEMVGHIVENLRHDILARQFAPGARLIESELTLRFGVSRGPVREALRRLAAEGLIEHHPNRGALVRRLSQQDIRELFAIRIELEALAARLAAENRDEGQRAAFATAIAPIFESKPRASPVYLDENAAFHSAVMTLAGNGQLHELALRLQLPLIMAQVGGALTPAVLEESVREHRVMAAAILAHDAPAADVALRMHLGRAAKLAVSHLAS